MSAILPTPLAEGHPKPHTVCPKCGRQPSHRAELVERGIIRGTYAHGSHIWITEWAA